MLAPHSTQCWQNPASAPVLKMVQVLLNSGHDDRIRKYCCRNWIGQRQNRRGHKLAISSPALLCVYALVHASAGAWGGRTPTLDVFCSYLTNFLFSCLCMNHVCGGGKCCGDQERTLDSRELELQVIASIQMWMLETELHSLKDQWLLFSFLFILQALPT